MALLLTLLIFLILAAVVSELVITSRLDYQVARNDASLAKLDMAMESVLKDTLDSLRQDYQADASASQAAAGAPPTSGTSTDPQQQKGPSDSLEDEWAQDTEKTMGDVRVSVHVEDENRKLNLLSLLSPDEAYAKVSYERLVRLLDRFREETDRDLASSDAERIAEAIQRYLKGTDRPQGVPKPALLTDKPSEESSPALTMDELLMLEAVNEDLIYDSEIPLREASTEKMVFPGLSSMLTVWTSLQPQPAPAAPGTTGTTANNATNQSATTQGASSAPPVGVKININTAPRAVLKSLLPENEFPPDVIEGIIRYRNTEQEITQSSTDSTTAEASLRTDPQTGEEIKPKQFFSSLEDLKKVPEFQNFPDEKSKENLRKLITIQSDVFSIYLTAKIVESNDASTTGTGAGAEEEESGKMVRRVRAVYWRRQGQKGVELIPVLRWEVRGDKKLVLKDYAPEDMPRR